MLCRHCKISLATAEPLLDKATDQFFRRQVSLDSQLLKPKKSLVGNADTDRGHLSCSGLHAINPGAGLAYLPKKWLASQALAAVSPTPIPAESAEHNVSSVSTMHSSRPS